MQTREPSRREAASRLQALRADHPQRTSRAQVLAFATKLQAACDLFLLCITACIEHRPVMKFTNKSTYEIRLRLNSQTPLSQTRDG